MPISRTINYTQNVAISLGFSNYLSNATTASIEFVNAAGSKMGYITTTEVTGVDVTNQSYGTSPIFPRVVLTGSMADLNTALNSAIFQSALYEADTLVQNFTSQDYILPSDYRGEFQIQISPDAVHGLSVGSTCRLSTSGGKNYTVTKVDSSNSATRIWMIATSGYDVATLYYGNPYAAVGVCNQTAVSTYTSYYLQNSSGTNLAPINDISYVNPHGDFSITMYVKNSSGTVLDSGTISFVGSFFVAEPTFSVQPLSTLAASGTDAYYNCDFGQIAQADSNHQSVQLLMKYYENDPLYLGVAAYTSLPGYPSGGTDDAKLAFVGAAIDAKAQLDIPEYVTDTSMGFFSTVHENNLSSTSPTSGVVRWHFFGVPSDCNYALRNVIYYRPPSVTKDFKVETRIVNGRTRIYSARGK